MTTEDLGSLALQLASVSARLAAAETKLSLIANLIQPDDDGERTYLSVSDIKLLRLILSTVAEHAL